MTPTGNWRHSILRFYWDDETEPRWNAQWAFLRCGWGKYCQISSLPCASPRSAFNCYWQMPFRKKRGSRWRTLMQGDDALLSDELHAD